MKRFLNSLSQRQDIILIGLLMTIVVVMIIPLPTPLIDLLIATNLSLTMMVLVVAVYLKRPEEFSALPAVILIATTFRLAITISTTRLILAQANAGAIIDTFGNFVTRGSLVVGLVIFLIITTVQFLVITKGSERVAEVAARFSLDGMPGRQMSIDAELRNGDITAAEAQLRRIQLEKENQFFGAMDGAMKFVKGDAIAGLIIVAINLIGGIGVGLLSKGMPIEAALNVYSRLTVGDGLVSQIPALLLSMCAGTIITRVNSGKNADLGSEILAQLAGRSRLLYTAAAMIAGLGLIPGFPLMLFLTIAALLAGAATKMARRERREAEAAEPMTADGKRQPLGKAAAAAAGDIDASADDTVIVAVGSAVFKAIDRQLFAVMRERELDALQEQTGLAFQPFGIALDLSLGANEIRILLDRVAGFSAALPDGVRAAVCDPDILTINGFGGIRLDSVWRLRSAYWVDPSAIATLEAVDAQILDPTALIVRTTGSFVRRNAHRILGYRHVQLIVKELGIEHEQLAVQISQTISAVQLLNVMRRLLLEGVPLAPRRLLFEAMLEASVTGGSAGHLAGMVRTTMARQICAGHADQGRVLAGHLLEPALEVELRSSLARESDELALAPRPEIASALLEQVSANLQAAELGAQAPILVTVEELRWPLSKFLRTHGLDVTVLAFGEITPDFLFTPVGTLSVPAAPIPIEELAA